MYVLILTAQHRKVLGLALKELLEARAAPWAVLEQVLDLVEDAAESDSKAVNRLLAEQQRDCLPLDFDWVEETRQRWSAESGCEWTTADVLAVVMGAATRGLWQPRGAA